MNIGFIVLFVIVATSLEKWRRTNITVASKNSAILLAYYTQGREVNKLHEGVIGDMNYQYLYTTASSAKNSEPLGLNTTIVRVELPFRTKVHLLGIAKNSGEEQINPSYGDSTMEAVSLEGNYDKHFSLYAEKGQQLETRYHLDPAAMVFTIDFCGSHNWEIINDELYFAQSGAQKLGDNTTMLQDVEEFVDQIAPAIKLPLTKAQERMRTPYNDDRRKDLKCPICNKLLINNGEMIFACPNNDGYLVGGSALTRIRKGKQELATIKNPPAHKRDTELVCPSCASTMQKTAYAKGQEIDSCTECTYRWIDMAEAGNLARIA